MPQGESRARTHAQAKSATKLLEKSLLNSTVINLFCAGLAKTSSVYYLKEQIKHVFYKIRDRPCFCQPRFCVFAVALTVIAHRAG